MFEFYSALKVAETPEAPRPFSTPGGRSNLTPLSDPPPYTYDDAADAAADAADEKSGQPNSVIAQAAAAVSETAQLTYEELKAKLAQAEAQLLNLKAQVDERRAQLTLAEKQLARQRGLLSERATSQDAFDSADANRKVAAAQIAALEAQLEQTESTLRGDEANRLPRIGGHTLLGLRTSLRLGPGVELFALASNLLGAR